MNQQLMLKYLALPQAKRDALQVLVSDPAIMEVLPAFMPDTAPVPVTGMTQAQKLWQTVITSILTAIMAWLVAQGKPTVAPPVPPLTSPVVAPATVTTSATFTTSVPASPAQAAVENESVKPEIVTFSVWDGEKWRDAQGPLADGCPAWLKKLESPPLVSGGATMRQRPLQQASAEKSTKSFWAEHDAAKKKADPAPVVEKPLREKAAAPKPAFKQSAITHGPHWTHPGTIANHLWNGHGVDPAGMTQEEMLSYHDALHEGRAKPQQRRVARIN